MVVRKAALEHRSSSRAGHRVVWPRTLERAAAGQELTSVSSNISSRRQSENAPPTSPRSRAVEETVDAISQRSVSKCVRSRRTALRLGLVRAHGKRTDRATVPYYQNRRQPAEEDFGDEVARASLWERLALGEAGRSRLDGEEAEELDWRGRVVGLSFEGTSHRRVLCT